MCKFGIKIHTSPCKTKQKPKKQKQTPNVASRPQRPQGFLGTGEAKDAHLDFHTPPEKHKKHHRRVCVWMEERGRGETTKKKRVKKNGH